MMADVDYTDYGYAKREIEEIFQYCIAKWSLRINKKGNTLKPWNDFSSEHLEKRLFEEIEEYKESRKIRELIDVINLSVFLYLAKQREIVEDVFNKKENV